MSSKDWVDCYRNKTILITGATGFVGKAILWHLLKAVGGVIDKVYVLIRPKRIPGGSPSQRLLDEIINTKYESSLEWNLETNVLGTIRLMDYLSTCSNISSFIYLSPIHIHTCIPTENEDTLIKEQVYDLAGLGDPEELLKSLLGADEKELPNYVKRILQKYSTLHLFTKALVEHLIIRKTNDYWSRPNNALLLDQKLPTAKNYFSANKTLTKARFLIRYYFRPNAKNTVAASKKLDIDQSKWLELASNIRNNLAKQHTHQWQYDTTHFQQLPLTKYIDMYLGLDEYNYFMQSCYGTKIYSLHGGAHARAPTLDDTSACALYSINKYKTMTPDKKNQYYPEVIDEPFPSIVYTEEEMKQRVKDMMDITIKSLHHLAQSLKEEKVWKPVWIEYINDTLEDWCTMIETLDTDSKNNLAKRWKLTGNAEMTKVAVLNDPNVIEAIQQVGYASRKGSGGSDQISQ
ncbi:hypothetical protein RMCBS344292_02046 [Rhizopus microsporus]|nr:hypothetical protein RMCBS344292_02046 [Rhizopus microsporus]